MTFQESVKGLDDLTLKDRVYRLLKDSVIRHRFKPGERLLDQEIADNLGVSRTPVREALNRLGAEGLIEIVPRRGAFVIDLSAKDIKDIYEVREVLETLAIRLAVPRLSDEDLVALAQITEACSAALDRKDYVACFELDREFHDRVVRLSGNAKLAEINTLLGGNIQTTRWRHCQDGDRQQLSFEEHLEILEALKKRDAELASALVSDHINSVKRELLDEQQQDS
jgi:DNA-binding GntR family transcriptional regulator